MREIVMGVVARKNGIVRRKAVYALKEISGNNAFVLIQKVLEDEDELVRQAAIKALQKTGGSKAFPFIAKALDDLNSGVRQTAVSALGEIGGDKAFLLIAKAIKNQDSGMRQTAVTALGKIDGNKAFALIAKATEDLDSGVRQSAVSALVKNDGDKAAGKVFCWIALFVGSFIAAMLVVNATGYIVRWNSLKDAEFLADLLKQNIKVRFTEKPMTTDGQNFDRGSLIIVRGDNKKIADFYNALLSTAYTYHRKLNAIASGFSES